MLVPCCRVGHSAQSLGWQGLDLLEYPFSDCPSRAEPSRYEDTESCLLLTFLT